MSPLPTPDAHFLLASAGWLELGCAADALKELEGISEKNRGHPDAMEMRWLIHAQLEDWPAALTVATELTRLAPERASGWLHRAYALRRVPEGGLTHAWDALLPAFEKFPKEPFISYNLACYACRMGDLTESSKWLQIALSTGKPKVLKRMALDDDDLRELWTDIRKM